MATEKRREITERVYSEEFMARANAILAEWGASTCACGALLLQREDEAIPMDGEEHTADGCTEPDEEGR